MTNYTHKKNNRKDQRTALEVIFVGVFKALWWLVTLPFKKGKKSAGISNADKQYIAGKRREIEKMTQSDNIYELKHAVIEADKLVDHILQLKGYAGETFADRLRSAEKYMDHTIYQNLWEAHKIRNQVAHDTTEIGVSELKRSVTTFKEYTNG